MEPFDHKNYKEFVTAWVVERPRRGYGMFRKMAEHLRVHPVVISQVFKGNRDLSMDQAYELSEFMGLSEFSKNYFIKLVEWARAQTHGYKVHLEKELLQMQQKSRELGARIEKAKALDEKAQNIFYSDWIFSAVRLGSSIEGCDRAEDLAQLLNLPLSRVQKVLSFLLEHGLCVEEKGKIMMGPQVTHLPSESPLVGRHHLNWRIKAATKVNSLSSQELCYTGPMALSFEAAEEIRKELILLVERVTEKVVNSPSQTLQCLNIDWIQV